ncbi:hypothetical protein [Clostridium sp.]|uniref:hypothetical protein n=1 Tax=Clostridium sp. TaxID=1506 RepID=UPI0026041A4F|nr:hypothetical protein [uncultured Clostridium sp.]
MKIIKVKWIITIIGIMMIVFSLIHYGTFNIIVGVLCLVLVLIFMIWRYSDKSVNKHENKK